MDIDKMKIISRLGNGMSGSVSRVSLKKKEYALKIEKIAEKYALKKNLASREWREIEFSLNMANKHPDQFMTLYKYDVVDNCTHVQEYPNELKKYPVYLQKIFTKKNNSTYCIRKVYSLVDTVLKDVIRRLTVKQIYSMIAQTTYIIYLMKEYGYTHNDFHTQNIGVVYTDTKYMKIMDIKIPLFGYQYQAIDYGMVLHKKYKMDRIEKDMHRDNMKNEVMRLLKKLVTFEKNNQIKKLFDGHKHTRLFDRFIRSSDYLLVDSYDVDDGDRFILYQILFPDNAQKMFFGKEYRTTYQPLLMCELADILYFFNNRSNLHNIIRYCAIRLKK